MAMDALNRGWALGFATRVRGMDADLEAARERGAQAERPLEKPGRLDVLFALLLAIGPMARPAH
jgi:hypothetical protein